MQDFQTVSTLSQKVSYIWSNAFPIAMVQNKGNQEKSKKQLNALAPHAFGDHTECNSSWCGYKRRSDDYKT